MQLGIRVPEHPNQRGREIFIFDDRLNPAEVQLTANLPTRFRVADRSGSDRAAFAGDFVLPAKIAAGETRGISLTPRVFAA